MKIALCDDDINFIQKFGSILNEKIMRYSDDFSITEFTCGKEFIVEIDKFDAVTMSNRSVCPLKPNGNMQPAPAKAPTNIPGRATSR